jgi:predicted ATPase
MSELADLHSLPEMEAKAKIYGGWANAMNGASVEQGFEIQKRSGTASDFPLYHELHAYLLGRIGMVDGALRSLDEVIAKATAGGSRFWLPELLRRRAKLRRMYGGNFDDSLADLLCAKREASLQGVAPLLSRVNADLFSLNT